MRLKRYIDAARRSVQQHGGGLAGLRSVLARAVKVLRAMGVRGLLARLRAASTVRRRVAEPLDVQALPEPVPLEELQMQVGVMAHVFYADLIDEFAQVLARMPLPFTLLVSVMDAAAEAQARERFGRLANVCTLVIKQVPNRGRDIAPLLVAFREEVLSMDVICHIHTKKSLYTGSEQERWRHYLLDSLLGSSERIAWILGTLQADPKVGLVYPESYQGVPLWAHTWLSNGPACDALAQQLGIALDHQRYIDFPAGSMFWARVDALRPLYQLDLPLLAFPPEQGQVDGTLQHAVERMFGVITRHQGYRLGILPVDGRFTLETEGERNVVDLLQAPLSERLQMAALNARLVTVDIFDTLVTRAFLTPAGAREHLAWRLQQTLAVTGFSTQRASVENQLREQLRRDPTLAEIHTRLADRLGLPGVTADTLIEAERAHERAVLQPRRGVLAALQQTRLVPLTVFSDMYLSTTDMQIVLPPSVQAEIGHWWISCETGLRKDSKASWQQIAQREDRSDGRWLHIGDNEHADIQMPQLAGLLSPVHVLRPSALLDVIPALRPLRHGHGAEAAWPEQLWRGLVANRFAELLDTAPQQLSGRPELQPSMLGYVVLGPFVLDFLLHATGIAHRRGVDQLLFLSREGYLLHQAFERLQGSHAGAATLVGSYFLASRRATLLPSLLRAEDLPRALQGTFNGSLRQLLQARLGEDAAATVEAALPGLIGRDVFLPEMADEVAQWLLPALPALLDLAAQQRHAYRTYWAGTVGERTPMVVDIGYAGSIQRNLAQLLQQPLGGCYMALTGGAHALLGHGWAEARYVDGRLPGSDVEGSVLLAHDLLLESLLAAPQGQFNGFDTAAGTQRFGAMELSTEGINVLAEIHQGALEFIDDVCAAIGGDVAALSLDPQGTMRSPAAAR
uniref:Polysaccharide biosynthesis protein n=1 Tax=Knufia peltigerae TaxID=1002370 RepID=A0AA38Y197_9EURO|nr:hypothetical protein H2204_007806 [Knufia peltigerae]